MKPQDQGQRWRRELVERARARGLVAGYLAEEGIYDPNDAWIGAVPEKNMSADDRVILAWKRLTGDGSRRTPDGERDVVVLSTADFLDLVYWSTSREQLDVGWVVECKARENVNVTRILGKARKKLARWKLA